MQEAWRSHPAHGLDLEITEVIMKRAWSRATAAGNCQTEWAADNPAFGQCAVTTAVLWKFLKEEDGVECEILRAEVEGFGSHYWLRLPDGTEIDMTRCQFPAGTVVPEGETRTIEYLLESERAKSARTKERAALLEKTFNGIAEAWFLAQIEKAVVSLDSDKSAPLMPTVEKLLDDLEKDVEEKERAAAETSMEEGEAGAASMTAPGGPPDPV